jgi:hypothetical protein
MQIIAKKTKRCAYPPIGRYISTPPAAKSFEAHQIQFNSVAGVQLRPDGVRQPAAEARILANINLIKNGLAPRDGCVLNRG